MKIRLLHLWDTISSSYWFVPLVLQIGAIVLSYSVLLIDGEGVPKWWPDVFGSFVTDRDSARSLLSTIAASMVTTASVTFSITMVALTMTSSQFGPRLLRGFMRDRVNQFVLGCFLATFSFCILVLRTISDPGEFGPQFIPRISIVVALALAIANVFVLIGYIHHVSISISADAVIASVVKELRASLESIFEQPDTDHQNEEELQMHMTQAIAANEGRDAAMVTASTSGYIQLVDYKTLTAFAAEHDIVLHLQQRAGDYAIAGSALGRAWPQQTPPEILMETAEHVIISDNTTAAQDIEHSLRQLVEVAVRALSPGVNDPFTAITCIDRLASSLCLIAERPPLQRLFYDEANTLRIIADRPTYAGCVETAFRQIRQESVGVPAVAIRLLEAITAIAEISDNSSMKDALKQQAEAVYNTFDRQQAAAIDLDALERRYQRALAAL